GGTALAGSVAGPGRIAHTARSGAAHERVGLNGVRGAGGACSRAGFGGVARARGGAAHRPRVTRRMLASDVAAVALVKGAGVAVVGTRCTVRLLGVGGAGCTRARAGLGQVALAGRRAAHGARGLEGISGTRGTRPVARLGHVAVAGSGAAHGPCVARRVLAESAATVTGVSGAWVTVVRTRRPARLLGIGGARLAGPLAPLRRVALARRRAAARAAAGRGVRGAASPGAGAVRGGVAAAGSRGG